MQFQTQHTANISMNSNSNITPISPVRDFKGDATVEVISTPSFTMTPSSLNPIVLFPTPSPSSSHFSTPDYRKHFSSFLEPTPSAPIPILNEFRWRMAPSVESTSTLSPTTSSDTDSPHSNSATGSLSNSNNSSSDSLQFKLSQTP